MLGQNTQRVVTMFLVAAAFQLRSARVPDNISRLFLSFENCCLRFLPGIVLPVWYEAVPPSSDPISSYCQYLQFRHHSFRQLIVCLHCNNLITDQPMTLMKIQAFVQQRISQCSQ